MLKRFGVLTVLWMLCGIISTVAFSVIWGQSALPSFGEVIAYHFAYGLLALPISFGSAFASVLPQTLSFIAMGLMWAFWPVLGYFQWVYMRHGTKGELIGAAALAITAAPFWLFYAVGMSGI